MSRQKEERGELWGFLGSSGNKRGKKKGGGFCFGLKEGLSRVVAKEERGRLKVFFVKKRQPEDLLWDFSLVHPWQFSIFFKVVPLYNHVLKYLSMEDCF